MNLWILKSTGPTIICWFEPGCEPVEVKTLVSAYIQKREAWKMKTYVATYLKIVQYRLADEITLGNPLRTA